MKYDNKNFLLAIVLSMLIIFGWQYFYAMPLQQQLTNQTETGQTQPDAGNQQTTATGGNVPGAAAGLGVADGCVDTAAEATVCRPAISAKARPTASALAGRWCGSLASRRLMS